MSSVSAISAIQSSSASAADYLPTIMSLQSDLLIYSRFASGTGPAATDFKALQYAIETRNVSQAEIELSRLRQESEAGNPISFQINTSQTGSNDLIANEIAASSAAVSGTVPPSGSLVNVTA